MYGPKDKNVCDKFAQSFAMSLKQFRFICNHVSEVGYQLFQHPDEIH